ncbi:MAG TPA: hypothetical protein PK788_02460 [Gemmatimonadaceae bacterium]|nr:hypothetical protein [Gemmatimonadaceae bacterium]HRQ77980.1 hypothetical protein [Gemmatimonadaceae bacterium]
MDLKRVAAAVCREYTLDLRGLHGVWHWLRVRQNGLWLAERTPGADPQVIELFALLHDSRRWDDGRDPEHGPRAADFARRLSADGILTLEAGKLEALADACTHHTSPRTSTDPTIGCCWDADRLELSRLSYPPDPRYLSTAAALHEDLQRWAWDAGYNGHQDRAGAIWWGFDFLA